MVEMKLPKFPYGAMAGAIIGAEEASIFEPLITSGQVDQLADPDPDRRLESAAGYACEGLSEGDAHPDPDAARVSQDVQ